MIRTFQTKGTWEGLAIISPTATVVDEPVGLLFTVGLIGKSNVVATMDDIGSGGTSGLGRVLWVLVV